MCWASATGNGDNNFVCRAQPSAGGVGGAKIIRNVGRSVLLLLPFNPHRSSAKRKLSIHYYATIVSFCKAFRVALRQQVYKDRADDGVVQDTLKPTISTQTSREVDLINQPQLPVQRGAMFLNTV